MYKHNPKLTKNARVLRKNMTKQEKKLWYNFLRTYPLRFLRQKVINNYIVDFYCASAKLVIELDGGQHYEPKMIISDKNRDIELNKYNLDVLRFTNTDIDYNFEGCCKYIDSYIKNKYPNLFSEVNL